MKNLRERFEGFRSQAAMLGVARTVQLRILRRLGVKEIKLSAKGQKNPVFVRVADSDIYEYNQSLGPWQEPFELPFEPKVIVDAGSNVGFTILRFSQLFPSAKIVAIEPDENNLKQLARNVGRNDNVETLQKALWPRSARLRITNSGSSSNAFIVEEDETGTIDSISIGDILEHYSLDTIDLLKVDIEGSEKDVFDDPGSQTWLPRVRALLVETHDNMRDGTAESVRRATQGHMTFQGFINEYEFYLSNSFEQEALQ